MSATNDGQINLSGVETLTAPTSGSDYIQITTGSGGQVDLSHLKGIGWAGSGT